MMTYCAQQSIATTQHHKYEMQSIHRQSHVMISTNLHAGTAVETHSNWMPRYSTRN